MMRTIKFRFWNGEGFKYFTLDNNFDCHVGWLGGFTLEQFTGLTDKNGKEIYEGDIVRDIDFNEIGLIEFGMYRDMDGEYYPVQYGFFIKRKEKSCSDDTLNDGISDPSIIEIIGNIHENPELLK